MHSLFSSVDLGGGVSVELYRHMKLSGEQSLDVSVANTARIDFHFMIRTQLSVMMQELHVVVVEQIQSLEVHYPMLQVLMRSQVLCLSILLLN